MYKVSLTQLGEGVTSDYTHVEVLDEPLPQALYRALRHFEYSGFGGSLYEIIADMTAQAEDSYCCVFEKESSDGRRQEVLNSLIALQEAARGFTESVKRYRE